MKFLINIYDDEMDDGPFTPDEELRDLARSREIARMDRIAQMDYAKKEGLAKGYEKGRTEEKLLHTENI